MVTSLFALCSLFSLALSYILPVCVLACVCTPQADEEKRGGGGSSGAQSYVFTLSLCKRKGGGEKL